MLLLQANPINPEGSPWLGYLNVLLFLAAILCFAYLLLFFLKQRVAKLRGSRQGGALELIDRLGLEPKRTLYVVRAGMRYVAIASSENGIQVLLELSSEMFTQDRSDATNKGTQS